jgi:hypothetical protein
MTRRRRAGISARLLVALVSVMCAAALLAVSSGQAAALSLPGVYTGVASNVTFSSAVINGGVNAKGQATNYVFQYGTTSAYGMQTPLAPAGNGTITIKVSQAITGLQPATVYHYRVVAISPSGTTDGRDHAFTTAKIPLSVQIVGTPNPVVFGNPFFVEGTLSGTGASTHEIVLQANPFPYLRGFRTVGNPEVTNSVGGFSFPFISLLENAQLRVVTVGKPVVASPVVVESVAVRVSFHVRRAGRRGYVRLFGTVAPAEVGALVGFQRLRPGKSVNEGGTAVTAGTARASAPSCVFVIAACTAPWSRSQMARTSRTTASRS